MGKNSKRQSKRKVPEVTRRDQVFVGLDVHKRDIHAAVRINGGEPVTTVMPAKAEAVLAYLKPYRPGLKKVVYEAGPTGYSLARALREEQIPVEVIAPGKIPRPAVRESKSDRLDCRKLAEYAEKGLLKPVAVPTPEEEALRQMARVRESFSNQRRHQKQQIKSFLLYHGLPEPPGLSHWSREAVVELRNMPMSDLLRFSLDQLMDMLVMIEARLAEVDAKLAEVLKTLHPKEVKRLRTHPGVGPVIATSVLAELYQPQRFDNSREIAAYVGLAPRVMQSGQTRKEGPLMRGGRAALRSKLVEGALVWVHHDPFARKKFNKLFRSTGSAKKAIVAMARRMLVNLWIMLTRAEDYRPAPCRA